MTAKKLACIVLAAGKGARMKSAVPKPLHKVAGRTMLNHVIAAAEELNPERIIVVAGQTMPDVVAAAKPHAVVIQETANGTGGAVLAAKDQLKDFDGDVLILYGDSPLIVTSTLQRIVDARRQFPAVGLVYAGSRPVDTARYGRMIVEEDGTLHRIVEFKDASESEKKVSLVNAGIVCADGTQLFHWLSQMTNDNAAGEYYLTDLPPIARRDNRTSVVVEISEEEMEGANTLVELAKVERLMQNRLREKHMLNGATLIDPASVFFSHDTVIGRDVHIGPNVFFGTGVTVADNVDILPFCHIEGAVIESGAKIGSFARLRPGSKIGANARIGNFVETKNVNMGAGAKASHLAYLGDADIGENANIGAGVITCNYDGFLKYRTVVGKDAFVGSNASLIAPVTVGNGAYIGAGSSVYEDVQAGALGITRAPQINLDGWAAEFRRKKIKEKAKGE